MGGGPTLQVRYTPHHDACCSHMCDIIRLVPSMVVLVKALHAYQELAMKIPDLAADIVPRVMELCRVSTILRLYIHVRCNITALTCLVRAYHL